MTAAEAPDGHAWPDGNPGVLWIGKHGRDGGIRLAGPELEVSVFRVPAGQCGVILRDGFVSIGASRPRRVHVQMILKNFFVRLVQPLLEESRLPKPSQMIRGVRARQVFDRRILIVSPRRPKRGRRARTEIVCSV